MVSTVIWYEVLNHVNIVSKKLQSKDMHLDNAITEINKLIGYFKDYRETDFSKAIDEAKKIAIEMGIDPIFPQKCLIERKKGLMSVQVAKKFDFHLKRTSESIISYTLLIKLFLLLREYFNNSKSMTKYLVFYFHIILGEVKIKI